MLWIWIQALVVNGVLISFAQRTPLLTTRGWIHAAALGTMLWGCLGWRGWLAVAVYLVLGSLVTRIGFANKQQRGIAEARDGRRGPENVWGSAAVGAALALILAASPQDAILWRQVVLIGFSASFAAKLADTFGSEIGKRWGRMTVLITTLRPVAPGTDGAISLEGTMASAVGSVLMTLALWGLSSTQLPFIPNAINANPRSRGTDGARRCACLGQNECNADYNCRYYNNAPNGGVCSPRFGGNGFGGVLVIPG